MEAWTDAVGTERDAQKGAHDAVEHALLGLVPILITAFVVYKTYTDGNAAVDFQHSFWTAGWRTLHGLDPYSWTRADISGGVSFPYPAFTALLLAPFALLSRLAASVPITAACLIAAPLSLWILRVRDWRVYGAVALWLPLVSAWQTANFTMPILVATALLWRCRERQGVAAALVGCLVSIKPIMAPLWIWLLLTRGWRPAAGAVLVGLALNAVSWSVVGWSELSRWLHLLSLQGSLRDGTGYSLIALAKHLGLSEQMGVMLMVCCACILIGVVAVASREGQQFRIFAVALLLTIVASPQVDIHYFVLLAVPLAVTRPRLAWSWLVPIVLWPCQASNPDLWQIILWWALLGALATQVLALRTVRAVAHDLSAV